MDRTGYIGGTDAAVIAGENKRPGGGVWKTPRELWAEKVGLTEDQVDSEAAFWGTRLEPEVLKRYAQRNETRVLTRYGNGNGQSDGETFQVFTPEGTSWVVKRGGDHPFTDLVETLVEIRHPDFPWMRGHMDGWEVTEDGDPIRPLEAKTASAWRHQEFGPEGTDEIPTEYIVQCQHYGTILKAWDLPADFIVPTLIGGQAFREFLIQHREAIATALLERERDFWHRVQEQDPPPVEPEDTGLLTELFPEDSGEEIIVETGTQPEEWIREYARAHQERKDADRRKKEAQAKLYEFMGEATKLSGETTDGRSWSFTWKKPSSSEKVDWEAAFRALRDVADVDPDVASGIVDEYTEIVERARRPYPYIRNLTD